MSLLRSVAFAFLGVLFVSMVMLSGCPAPQSIPDDGSWYAVDTDGETPSAEGAPVEGAVEGEGNEGWFGLEGEGEGEGEGWDSREGETTPDTPVVIPPTPVAPEVVVVPASTFAMGATQQETGEAPGSTLVAGNDETPRHDVTLAEYSIGKTEVTNAQYAAVLNWALAQSAIKPLLVDKDGKPYAGGDLYYAIEGGALPVIMAGQETCQVVYSGTAFAVRTRQTLSMENHPVVMVSWYGAALYCNWLNLSLSKAAPYDTATWRVTAGSGRYVLPTEAQWERAAAWSFAAETAKRFLYGNGRDILEMSDGNFTEWILPDAGGEEIPTYANPLALRQFPYTTPAGYYNGENQTKDSLSPAGCRDMAGNAAEWCEDWYAAYASTAQTNPRGPLSGTLRCARGGSWYQSTEICRASNRLAMNPVEATHEVGFRVVLQ